MRSCMLYLSLLLVLTGCPDAPNIPIFPPVEKSGAMLVSHGDYLYFLGGVDEFGKVSSRTYVATIPRDSEQELVWTETTPMPFGRAYGAVFAVGNLLFVAGGRDDTGAVSTIYYTSISSSDGTLGFSGTPRFWERNPNDLPYALSHASHVLHDGRVFLIGGKTSDGMSDSIIHARVWQKGPVGMWYTSAQRLPSGRHGTGATIWYDSADSSRPYLLIAGGIDSHGSVLRETTAFAIGKSGKLAPSVPTTSLPKALFSPLVLSDASQVWVAGGADNAMQLSSTAYRATNLSGSWTVDGAQVSAEGPFAGRGNGRIWFIEQGVDVASDINFWEPVEFGPAAPVIGPGSGIVQSNTTVTARGEAGTTVSYSTGNDQWNDISLLGKIATDQVLFFKSTSSDTMIDSPVIVREYQIRPLSFLVPISGSIQLQDQEDSLSTIYLTDDLKSADATGRSYIWAKFRLFAQTDISIRWEDASSAEDNPYTANIVLSLFEEDLLSETLSTSGDAIVDLSIGTTQPVEATLQSGTYYFLFEDADGTTGRSFGLSVSQRE